jgi:hypothetical protein
LNDEIEKKIHLKNGQKNSSVNLANPQNSHFLSRNRNNFIEIKSKNYYKYKFSINSMLKDEVEKNINKK